MPSPPPPPHSPAACTPPHISNENHYIICELPHDARAHGSCHSSNYSRAVLGGCGRRHSMGGRHRATSMAAHAGSHDRGQVPGALSAAACARRARRDAPYVSWPAWIKKAPRSTEWDWNPHSDQILGTTPDTRAKNHCRYCSPPIQFAINLIWRLLEMRCISDGFEHHQPPTCTALSLQRPRVPSTYPCSTFDTHFVVRPCRSTARSVTSRHLCTENGVSYNGGMQEKRSISPAGGRCRLNLCHKTTDKIGFKVHL